MKRATLVPFVFVAALVGAQEPIDKAVAEAMAASKTPGISIAIIREGKLQLAKGYGFADLEAKVPAGPDTVYELGSVTKQFTATLVMMLVEQRKLKLDESILTYMPGWSKEWKAVTIRHLLNHTSGIKSYTEIPGLESRMLRPIAAPQLVAMIAKEKPDFAPGDSWKYNNSGYFLLGAIIEKVTGKKYVAALEEMVLRPLGMTHTGIYPFSVSLPNRAKGYGIDKGAVAPAEKVDLSWPFSAGALMSNVEDMAKWASAQGSVRLLTKASWDQMWTPTVLNNGTVEPYGFAWSLGKTPGSRVIEHGGAIPGFSSQISRYPEKDLTVVVLANSLPSRATPLASQIAGIIDPSLKMPDTPAIADKDSALSSRLRKIFLALVAGDPDPSEFTEDARKQLFPDKIKAASPMLKQMGEMTRFELIAEQSRDGVLVRKYAVSLGATKLLVTFALDSNQKIAGVQLQPG